MKQSSCIFHIQISLFKNDKGMLVFYFFAILLSGIILPLIVQKMNILLSLVVLITVSFIKPILADSFAGDRERKTLESLLATGVYGNNIIKGKLRFSILFATVFYGLIIFCIGITNYFSNNGYKIEVWQLICVIVFPILNFITISIVGIYISAKSSNLRTANSKISKVVYPLGLLLMIFLSVVFLNDLISTIVIAILLITIEFCLMLIYIIKISKMRQFDYFENIKTKENNKSENYNKVSYVNNTKSQLESVFRHELRYLFTLKTLLLNYLLLCFAPLIIVILFKYYLDKINLYYAVFITILMIPRTSTNLIAYSIGGEKSYKTGESLLSTPLKIKDIFLGKSMIPIIVSTIMLIFSSTLTLIGINVLGSIFKLEQIYLYSADQLMLLFPVGIMSCITMIFITGVLSLSAKTPRHGLYISSIVGNIFVLPPLMIIYLTQNIFIWSLIYFLVLIFCNMLFMKNISRKISRTYLMNKF